MSRQSGFELPPQSPDERDRQLALLEAREEHRELDTLDADRRAEKTDVPWFEAVQR